MNRRVAVLLSVGLAASGCRTPDDRRPKDRADPAARTQPAGRSWLDGPGPKLADVGVPKADSWADARDPGYDQTRDVQGVLAGYVEDPDGRKAREVFIEVEPTDGGSGGAPVGTQTGRDGYFLIKGLKPNTPYQLTVRAKVEGKDAAGRVYARTGTPSSQRVRLALVENMALPTITATGGPPPLPDDRPPREPRADARPDPRPAADPSPLGEPPNRPELTTGQPGLARPPVTNIAPPGVVPPASREARAAPSDRRFALVSPAGDRRDFPGPGLMLLDFMTTTCLPCKRAIPTICDLQARHGLKGLDVVGVACDDTDLATRQVAAGRYQRDEGLNYLLYVEPGDRPGALGKRFGVSADPTLVLLDAAGAVLWQGHPNDAAELERAIRDRLP